MAQLRAWLSRCLPLCRAFQICTWGYLLGGKQASPQAGPHLLALVQVSAAPGSP